MITGCQRKEEEAGARGIGGDRGGGFEGVVERGGSRAGGQKWKGKRECGM